MTRLFNDPNEFVSDMSRGFALASSRWVQAVPGGVVRSTRAAEPTVSLVIGGGSGHFPAFSGLVGPGLAHGAAMGNVFASPSTNQILSVTRRCDQGRGVLFSYGNYAGDVLNFDQAQAELRAQGIDVRTVVVTDDIFSAPRTEAEKRRGIAGDLVVFKIAGAAAEAGLPLDEVERLARAANSRTRSIGVAFSGCTLPGADEPLFTVPKGRMAIGLGIHGEPGIEEIPMPAAGRLAELLVSKLLAEAPPRTSSTGSGSRVVPILNGLGTVKYEELYLLYGLIDPLLREAGLEIVAPEVGEFCTSFDMAGLSLTLLWLDEELEDMWSAPCSSAAFSRGTVDGSDLTSRESETPRLLDTEPGDRHPGDSSADSGADRLPASSPISQELGVAVAAAVSAVAAALAEAADELGQLDRVAGDGDHGIGMHRGSKAAAAAAADSAERGAGASSVLSAAGRAWADAGGGTSGVIWGRIVSGIAAGLDDTRIPRAAAISTALSEAVADIADFGGVEIGDKTLFDALVPFAEEFIRTIESAADATVTADLLAAALDSGARSATEAAESTADLVARRGRSRAHGDKSLGCPDPGAVSLALIARTLAETLNSGGPSNGRPNDDSFDHADDRPHDDDQLKGPQR